MSDSPAPNPSLDRLLAALVEDTITDAEYTQLGDLLRHDRAAQRLYVDYLMLDRGLSVDHDRFALPPTDAARPFKPHSSASRSALQVPRFVLPLAAALLLAAGAVAIYLYALPADSEPLPADRSAFLATVVEASDGATLLVNDQIVAPGSDVHSGEFTLDGGEAEFRVTNGVGVRISGRTRLVMHDPMHATLTRGAATFDCPQSAKGYTVLLPGGSRVVDLGTVFTVSHEANGSTRVRVEKGSVEVFEGETESGVTPPGRVIGEGAELVLGSDGRLDRGESRIVNANFDLDPPGTPLSRVTGWQVIEGEAWISDGRGVARLEPREPAHGKAFLLAHDPANRTQAPDRLRLSQTIALDDEAEAIDNGLVRVRIEVVYACPFAKEESVGVLVEALDENGVAISSATDPAFDETPQLRWATRSLDLDPPAGTRALRIILSASRTTGDQTNVAFDRVDARVVSLALEEGAHRPGGAEDEGIPDDR